MILTPTLDKKKSKMKPSYLENFMKFLIKLIPNLALRNNDAPKVAAKVKLDIQQGS